LARGVRPEESGRAGIKPSHALGCVVRSQARGDDLVDLFDRQIRFNPHRRNLRIAASGIIPQAHVERLEERKRLGCGRHVVHNFPVGREPCTEGFSEFRAETRATHTTRPILDSSCELRDGESRVGFDEPRREFRQGSKYEGAGAHPGMRNHEVASPDADFPIEEQIEVERTRAPVRCATSRGRALEGLNDCKEGLGA
jgi:hypothetical protein